MRGPGARTLHKATRTAIVCTAVFMIGRYGLNDDQFAVVGAFAAFALSAFADFGGPPRARLGAYLGAALTGVPLVALGTAVSETTWAAALVTFAVVFLAAFAGLYGGYLAAGVNTIILLFVVCVGVPAPVDTIGSRLAGLAVGAVLAALGSVALWPDHTRSGFRRPLAHALETMSAWVGAAAAGRDAPRARAVAEAAVEGLRPELARMVDRPSGTLPVDRAQAYLVYNLDRLRDLTARLVRTGAAGEGPPEGAVLLGRARDVLDQAAAAVEGSDAQVPAAGLLAAVRADIDATPAVLHRAALADADPQRLMRACERTFTAQELAATAAVAGAHARAAGGRGEPLDLAGGVTSLRPGPAGYRGPLREGWRRARINLTFGSPYFRSSLRVAIGLAAALGIVKAFELRHGFWVALAALVVMRSCARETSATAFRAVIGVLLGFALSLGLVLVADVHHWIYAVVLPLAFFAAVLAADWIGLIAGQAAFCVLVVALFNLMKPGSWELGLVRVEDVLIGAGVGIAIGALIWPRGAAGQLRTALGTLLETSAGYAAGAARSCVAGVASAADGEARELALIAARRAEDAFAVYLTERRPTHRQLTAWSEALVAGDRLWYTADRAALRASVGAAAACAPLSAELRGAAARMEAGYRALARAVAGDREPPAALPGPSSTLDDAAAACARRAGGGGDGEAAAASLLWVRYWMGDLFEGLRRASARLAGAPGP